MKITVDKKMKLNVIVIVTVMLVVCSGHHRRRGRSRGYYRNTLMRMHYHSWTYGELLDAILHLLQTYLVPNIAAAESREFGFSFFLDPNNNGTSNFFGLNVSQRNVAYVSASGHIVMGNGQNVLVRAGTDNAR